MTKRPERNERGVYVINGKSYPELFGSRRQVWHGTAYKTAGNLTKSQLHFNKSNKRIVSLKKHITAKKERRLEKAGYFTRKGKFGYVKRGSAKHKKTKKSRMSRRSRGHRGGEGSDEDDESPAVDEESSEEEK